MYVCMYTSFMARLNIVIYGRLSFSLLFSADKTPELRQFTTT